MSRACLWLCALVFAFGLGAARAQSPPPPPGPPPREYTSLAEVEADIARNAAVLADLGQRLRTAAETCDYDSFPFIKAFLESAIRGEQAALRAARVAGSQAGLMRTRLDEAAVGLEFVKADIPDWTACRRPGAGQAQPTTALTPGTSPPPPPKPPEPPREDILGEIDYVDPTLPGGPPTETRPPPRSQIEEDVDEVLEDAGRPDPPPPSTAPTPLPPGVQRPVLQPIAAPALPERFCSEVERVRFLQEIYNPQVAAANANARAATAYQAQVTRLADDHMRRGDGTAWGVLLAEHRAFQPVMEDALAEARTLGDLYGRIMAIPAGDCPQMAEAAPPAVAVPGAGTIKVAAPGPKEDCPPKPGRKPIAVGPNGRVGSGARLKSKAVSTALGLAGGLLGGGGSPVGGGGGSGPPLVKCRIKESEMAVFRDPETGTVLKVGAKRARDTLVVFARIDRSADSGTFQAAFLQKPDGAVLAPAEVGICDLWGEWKLTVSWTKETYVDNQLVSRETGGWSEGGRFALPGLVSATERPDGLWRRLGFSNASHGARMVALQYRLPAAGLAETPVEQVIHVTRPSLDPVTTTPFALTLAEGPQGFSLAEAPPGACPVTPPGVQIADGARPPPGGMIQASNPAPGPTVRRDERPDPISRAEPLRSESLVDLRVEAELARARAAELGGADTPQGARTNVQTRINVLDDRLRRLDEAITQVGGTIEAMKAWEASEEARKVWTKEDTLEDMVDPLENAGELGVEIGLLALGQPELAPLVVLLDTSEVAMRKAAKELALRDLRQNIADQKLKLTDLYGIRRDIQLQRNAEARRLKEVEAAIQEFQDKTAAANQERNRLVVERDAATPIRDRADLTRDQGLTEEEREAQRRGPPAPADAVRPADGRR